MNDGPVGDGSYGDDLLNQSSGDPPDAANKNKCQEQNKCQVRSSAVMAR